jgi:PIN domain nuclease of toxin-antitoxin system
MPTTVSNGLLLDTHALLWAVMDPDKLGSNARVAITAVGAQVRVSHVSLWELAIKRRLGKLSELDRPALEWFESNVSKSRFLQLSIAARHLGAVELLPSLHGDPFDRLLVAQAQAEGLTIVTLDPHVAQYDVHTVG